MIRPHEIEDSSDDEEKNVNVDDEPHSDCLIPERR